MECPKCMSDNTEIIGCDSDLVKGRVVTYNYYRCLNCEFEFSDEPDWDSMSGGHDDY